jgi:F-type H+-transporting ATPase subunit c
MRAIYVMMAAVAATLLGADALFAQAAAPTFGPGVGAGIGAGLTIFGAGIGLGLIGYSALASMARQPEFAGRLQTTMLIIAALLEGTVFFSLIICILLYFNAK